MMKILTVSLLFLSTLVVLCQGRLYCSNKYLNCLNGGTCNQTTGRCKCPPRYFGETCDHMNECHRKCPPKKVCVESGNTTRCSGISCSIVADIGFVLDFSGSIAPKDFKTMVQAVEDFVKKFDFGKKKIRFSFLLFNDFILPGQIYFNTTTTKPKLLKKLEELEKLKPNGGTRTDKALKEARTVMFNATSGDRKDAPNILLVFTDGKSNKEELTKQEALKLKDTNIRVISVGIGDSVNPKELKLIATDEKDVFRTNFKMLRGLIDDLVKRTCNKTLDPCEKNPCKNGGKCKHFLTGYICECKNQYVGTRCQMKCNIKADIMVVIDESGSIKPQNFDRLINAVMFFIKSLDITSGKVRLGLITFAIDVFAHYDLDAFNNKLDLLFVTNLLRYKYRGGPTFTYKALKYLKKYSFTAERGDREKYPNYALVFSDGKSRFPWKTKKYAEKLQRSGVTVYSVGVGPKINRREIYYIASRPKKYHMLITSFIRLRKAMARVIMRVCKDLKPRPPCMSCTESCKCPSGMKCCKGCCQDTVTVLVCKTCPMRLRCGTSKDCPWPANRCHKGCCKTRRQMRRRSCKSCTKDKHCRCGWKCCRGCCQRPIYVEVGCMGKRICLDYPQYKKCSKGKQCCSKCSYRINNYVQGYGYKKKYRMKL